MEEYKVGETFQFGLVKLKCVAHGKNDCSGCALSCTNPCKKFVGECASYKREDHTDVIFVIVQEDDDNI